MSTQRKAHQPDLFQSDDAVISHALRILESRAKYGEPLTSPIAVREYLRLKIGELEREVFYCVWLNSQHEVIDFEEMFKGTLSQASVYPREIVKSALQRNAAAVILAHNHPSGTAEPSAADINMTSKLKSSLDLVDVRVLDHFVVTTRQISSFAERGLL